MCEAVERAERGLIDADLGGGVIKQRVARLGQGRSRGFRTIIFYRAELRAIFIDGFSKSDQDNIEDADLERFRALSAEFLGYGAERVRKLVEAEAWTKVECDD